MKIQKKQLAVAIALIGFGGHAQMAFAAGDSSQGQLERVEVTGSNIKRSIKQEKAAPVTVVRTEEMTKQGFTTVEQVVNSLASNQAGTVAASSVQSVTGGASYASLRGLGSQYTLVLLDGRRVANQAIGGYATDLNAIPLAAIDRIEVLRDGASAIYGSDAIGGVINFITKKSSQGVTISAEAVSPQHSGGKSGSFSVAGGLGNLVDDGFNVSGAINYQKINRITTKDRDFAYKYLTADNLSLLTFPSNFVYKGNVYNPLAPVCKSANLSPKDATSCGVMTNLYMDLTPEIEQLTAFAKASKTLGDHTLSLQYMGAKNTSTTSISPVPLNAIAVLTPGDKYYPATLPGGAPTDGSDVTLYARSIPLGGRVTESGSTTQGLTFNVEGLVAGWDYRGGVSYSENKTNIHYKSGYVNDALVRAAFKNGTINPWGPSAPGAWESVQLKGDGWISKFTTTVADFKASKELFDLPAGKLAAAFGTEVRREELNSQIQNIAKQALGSGIAGSNSTKGSRNVTAFYSELEIPLFTNFDAQLAARYDKYSDFGSAFNPKVAFKYQPVPQVMFRSSASKGFRAPTLFDVYQPNSTTYTAKRYNDPVQCPNGSPLPGVDPVQACKIQFERLTGGNTKLKPERASSLTFGVVVEPIKEVTASVDFWWTTVTDQVGALPDASVFGKPGKYADKFVRNPDGSLKYIITTTQNMGGMSASGVDVSLAYRLPKTAIGNVGVTLDGTYTSKYVSQLENGGAYLSSLGGWYGSELMPTLRWKHSLAFNWANGPASAVLVQNYSSGYTDQNGDGSGRNVKPYSNWNLSGSYVWNKKLTFTAGVRNLFDQAPPYSNQQSTFQYGYDPVIADSVGRAYFVKASYKM